MRSCSEIRQKEGLYDLFKPVGVVQWYQLWEAWGWGSALGFTGSLSGTRHLSPRFLICTMRSWSLHPPLILQIYNDAYCPPRIGAGTASGRKERRHNPYGLIPETITYWHNASKDINVKTVYVYQVITLYALKLCNVICQWYLNKSGKKNKLEDATVF